MAQITFYIDRRAPSGGYVISNTITVTATVDSVTHHPTGIDYDGESYWVCTHGDDRTGGHLLGIDQGGNVFHTSTIPLTTITRAPVGLVKTKGGLYILKYAGALEGEILHAKPQSTGGAAYRKLITGLPAKTRSLTTDGSRLYFAFTNGDFGAFGPARFGCVDIHHGTLLGTGLITGIFQNLYRSINEGGGFICMKNGTFLHQGDTDCYYSLFGANTLHSFESFKIYNNTTVFGGAGPNPSDGTGKTLGDMAHDGQFLITLRAS